MEKILLTVIVKDDTEIVEFERMLKSFMPYMAGLAVAVTGLGETKEIRNMIVKYKGKYVVTSPETHPDIYQEKDGVMKFMNFAGARNAVFKLAYEMNEKNKYDWFSWADTDDVLLGGADLQNIAMQAKGMDWVHFTYWYSVTQDENGNIQDVIVDHSRERLMSTKIQWKWVSRLHEICLPVDSNYQPNSVKVEYNEAENGTKTVWCHLPTPDHFVPNLSRNIDILELQVKEEQHKDPRTLFYLAKCYIDLSEKNNDPSLLQLAKLLLDEYLTMSGWAEERSFACQYVGLIYQKLGQNDEAMEWYHQAIKEHPVNHLPYLWLSHLYMIKDMNEEADHWLDVAMKLPPPVTRSTIGSPMEVKMLAVKLKYNQAMKRMDVPTAILYKKRQNELEGRKDADDEILKNLEDIKLNNDAALWLHNYAVFLKSKNLTEQLKHLLAAMAPEFRSEMFAQKLAREILEPTVWEPKTIAYVCATPFAPFNAETAMQEGIGGSETAVMRLSEEWTKLGYKVTVYANVTHDCEVNGVVYKHWNQVNFKDTFDILILWRNITLADDDLKARKIFVDFHDVVSNLDMTPDRLKKIDKIMVKSEYHRSMLPAVPDEKISIISNGI